MGDWLAAGVEHSLGQRQICGRPAVYKAKIDVAHTAGCDRDTGLRGYRTRNQPSRDVGVGFINLYAVGGRGRQIKELIGPVAGGFYAAQERVICRVSRAIVVIQRDSHGAERGFAGLIGVGVIAVAVDNARQGAFGR